MRIIASSTSSNSSGHHPLDQIMEKITSLQNDLELLDNQFPAFMQSMHSRLAPVAESLFGEYKDFVTWLGEQYCNTKMPKTQRSQIGHLAVFLHELAQDRLGKDLEPFIRAAGLGEFLDRMDNDATIQDEEIDRLIVAAMLDENFPDHILEELLLANEEQRRPSEDVEKWLHDYEARSSEKKAPRIRKKKSKVAEGTDPEILKKRLYHSLARDLHPDKAEVGEHEQRTVLMQQLNAAYRNGDLRGLLALLHVHGSAEMKAGFDDKTLKTLQAALDKQRKEVQSLLRTRLEMLPPIAGSWIKILRDPDAQEKLLRTERRRGEEGLKHFRVITALLKKPKELARFFREYDCMIWDEIF